jgi:hypothetical protein
MGPAKDLTNIWPTEGWTGFEIDTPFKVFLMGCSKLVAISFTVAGGLRGGMFASNDYPSRNPPCVYFSSFYFFLNDVFVRRILRILGYIFPLMCAGSAFGRLLYFVLPETVPLQIVVLCTAAAMNVAITRTALATTLILGFLPGEPNAIPPILMASICSLFDGDNLRQNLPRCVSNLCSIFVSICLSSFQL